jgi:hypothetical protein
MQTLKMSGAFPLSPPRHHYKEWRNNAISHLYINSIRETIY